MKEKLKDLSISVRLLLVGVAIFSIAYTLSIGLVGQALWEDSAEGSLIKQNGEVVGSELIGQEFDGPKFFHGRPSYVRYDAMKSGSQNLGPLNTKLENRVEILLEDILKSYDTEIEVPATLVTESGSALDPHITVQSALFQIPRISRNTGVSEEKLRSLVEKYSEGKLLGIYGLKRINVLKINLELDRLMEER